MPYTYFLGRAWTVATPPTELEMYVDVPFVRHGDLSHLHKLAKAVNAYYGMGWQKLAPWRR